jgi:hypothetical protein
MSVIPWIGHSVVYLLYSLAYSSALRRAAKSGIRSCLILWALLPFLYLLLQLRRQAICFQQDEVVLTKFISI